MGRNKYQGFNYDAIIIGSGIGGLTAGAYLAKHGVKVLICEQHTQPGGYFTSFQRQGYTFDGGIQGCEDSGMLFPMLKDLGLINRLKFIPSKYAIAVQDKTFPINSVSDITGFYRRLKKDYPRQDAAIEKLAAKTEAFCNAVLAFNEMPNPLFMPRGETILKTPLWFIKHIGKLKDFWEFFRLWDIPVEDYLKQFITDPELLQFVLQMAYLGSPASFGLAFISIALDFNYPMGGVQAIPNVLAAYITERGGEIKYRCEVEEIILEQGRARGVKTKSGAVMRAPFIISNGDMRRTFLKMLPSAAVPESFKQRLVQAKLSESVFIVFLGVDIPGSQIPSQGCHHIYYFPDDKGAALTPNTDDPRIFASLPIEIASPSLHDPSLAPPGKTALVLQCMALPEFFNNWRTEEGRRTRNYKLLKEEVTDIIIDSAARVIPGLRDKIEVQFSASPYTLARYTLNDGGATAGWTYNPRACFHRGGQNLYGFLTPVKNLYQVGHWTMSPGGAPAGFVSGKIVADIISRRLSWGI